MAIGRRRVGLSAAVTPGACKKFAATGETNGLLDRLSASTASRGGPVSARTAANQPDRPADLPRLLDITALAQHLGVNARHVRRLVAERRIPYVKWGHLIRFDPNEIATWIDDNRQHPGRPRTQ
jgi:excisionase family DNA binding protein